MKHCIQRGKAKAHIQYLRDVIVVQDEHGSSEAAWLSENQSPLWLRTTRGCADCCMLQVKRQSLEPSDARLQQGCPHFRMSPHGFPWAPRGPQGSPVAERR